MEKLHTNNNLPRLDLVQAHLERVLVSAEMRRSKKLCQFLRFTVEEVLRGHGSELKEYAIGVGAFQRSREFDTGADPIVRVQARRLRSKLQQYYQAEGRNEPMRIDYPVGSYSPVFVSNTPHLETQWVATPPRESKPIRHIAVLPFINVGGGDAEAFSDGLTDELIHAFSIWPGIRVIARSSCYQFKGKSEDIRRIGELLRVCAVVSGTVRIEGSQLRVLAQLIDAGTGVIFGSYAYDRELDGILVTQQQISVEIASILQPQIAHLVFADESATKT